LRASISVDVGGSAGFAALGVVFEVVGAGADAEVGAGSLLSFLGLRRVAFGAGSVEAS
jgi:hypothetical protein